MSNDDFLTDDYVAGVLAAEAKDCSLKFSAMGMDSKKGAANVPKPNTRFLRNIIKNTESHNKALLAKEEAHSKAKLEQLDRASNVRRRKAEPNAADIRNRQMGSIHAILGGSRVKGPKARRDTRGRDDDEGETRNGGPEDTRHGKGRRRRGKERECERGAARNADKRDTADGRGKRRSRGKDVHSEEEDDDDDRGRWQRERCKSPHRHRRSRSPATGKQKHRHRSPRRPFRRRRDAPEHSELTCSNAAATGDPGPREGRGADGGGGGGGGNLSSDSSEFGPAPPLRHRGRGTIGGAANLDRRFSESYDPRIDREDTQGAANADDDWGTAVDSYREMQKQRLQQSRPTGLVGLTITPPDAHEKSEKDVVWSKVGEERAWDQGKDAI